jgi:hypothetical protein
VVNKGLRLGVKSLKPSIARPYPQNTGVILVNSAHRIAAQAGRISRVMLVNNDLPRLAIQPVKPAEQRPDPQSPIPILVDLHDPTIAQARRSKIARWILRIRWEKRAFSVNRDLICPADVFACAIDSSDPQHAGAVLVERKDYVVAQAQWIVRVVPKVENTILTRSLPRARRRVKLAKPVNGSNP